eukprot:353391-Chlamydomonas_euryale.AAC.3
MDGERGGVEGVNVSCSFAAGGHVCASTQVDRRTGGWTDEQGGWTECKWPGGCILGLGLKACISHVSRHPLPHTSTLPHFYTSTHACARPPAAPAAVELHLPQGCPQVVHVAGRDDLHGQVYGGVRGERVEGQAGAEERRGGKGRERRAGAACSRRDDVHKFVAAFYLRAQAHLTPSAPAAAPPHTHSKHSHSEHSHSEHSHSKHSHCILSFPPSPPRRPDAHS